MLKADISTNMWKNGFAGDLSAIMDVAEAIERPESSDLAQATRFDFNQADKEFTTSKLNSIIDTYLGAYPFIGITAKNFAPFVAFKGGDIDDDELEEIEEKADNGRKSFCHDAPMPPFAADAIADLHFFQIIVHFDSGDRADGFTDLFQFDQPLIIIGLFIGICPICEDHFCHIHIAVRWPSQEFCYFFVACPVFISSFSIFCAAAAQDQSFGFQAKGSKMFHFIPFFVNIDRCWAGLS